MSVWSVMIILHATSAVVGFIVGVVLLSLQRAKARTWLMPTLPAALVGMAVGNVAATIAHWESIATIDRVIFTGLAILALYMIYRGWRAQQALDQPKTPAAAYTNDIGFILITLFEGLIIVVLPDLGVPAWITAIIVIATVLWGIRIVAAAKQRNLQFGIEK